VTISEDMELTTPEHMAYSQTTRIAAMRSQLPASVVPQSQLDKLGPPIVATKQWSGDLHRAIPAEVAKVLAQEAARNNIVVGGPEMNVPDAH
jgi:hypothetical protein